jgi:hypothetical protein
VSVDIATGEVRDEVVHATAETWRPLQARAESLVAERPEDPAAIAGLMYRIEQLLIEIANYLIVLNNERYDAERAHARRFNAALAHHGKSYQVSIARAMAVTDAEPEKAEHDAKRALFHYAEDTQKALSTKHYGLMNINKNLASVMFQQGARQ